MWNENDQIHIEYVVLIKGENKDMREKEEKNKRENNWVASTKRFQRFDDC